MSGQQLLHHRLATTDDRTSIEVWADDPQTNEPRVVTLWLDDMDRNSTELTPTEARALAALLIAAAERQERAS